MSGPAIRAAALAPPRDRLEATPVPGPPNSINPRFSPDGRQIAFSSGQLLDLKLVGLDGGAPVTIARGGSGASGGVAWSDDGWIYFDAIPGMSRVRPNGDSVHVVVPIDAAHGEAGQAWPDADARRTLAALPHAAQQLAR